MKKKEDLSLTLEDFHKMAKRANANTGLMTFINCKGWDGCSFWIVYGAKGAERNDILGKLAESLYSEDES